MEYIKVHKVVNPTCFIGLRGSEERINHCTTSLKTTPYDFTQASPKSVKSGQQVVCLSETVGWARGEIVNRLGEDRFQVQLLDYLLDAEGTPIVEDVRWESVKILPRRLSTERIPSLAGVFYLVDPDEQKCHCGLVPDENRIMHLLTQMAATDDEIYRCQIKKPLGPLHAVITIYLDLPLSGFFNGKVKVPYIESDTRPRPIQSGWTPQLNSEEWNTYHSLKDLIINAEDASTRSLIMDEVTNLLSNKISLEELEVSSDNEDYSAGNEGFAGTSSDLTLPTGPSATSRNSSSSRESPYRKEKGSAGISPSRKQRQAQKKKQRAKNRNVLNDDSTSTTSDSVGGDQNILEIPSPVRKKDKDYIPASFLEQRFYHCPVCGYVDAGHICTHAGKRNRGLADMWSRDN